MIFTTTFYVYMVPHYFFEITSLLTLLEEEFYSKIESLYK